MDMRSRRPDADVPAAVLAAAALIGFAGVAAGQGFSIDAASPSTTGGSNSAYLLPGAVGGPPVVAESAASLGLAGGSTDEVDSMVFGAPPAGNDLHFSVDRFSVGLAGDVVTEAAQGQAAADIFAVVTLGTNVLVVNQDVLGLSPASVAGTPATPPIDELDAFDFDYSGPGGGTLTGYTLVPGHSKTGSAVGCGGDLFLSNGGSFLLGYSGFFGLASCDDDVDAQAGDGTINTVYFSLAPGSPSLAPGSPITGCSSGCSAADVFVKYSGSPPSVYRTAAQLGLLTTDNVDALALGDGPDPDPGPAPVPSLSAVGVGGLVALLLGCGLGAGRPGQRAGSHRSRCTAFSTGRPWQHRSRHFIQQALPQVRGPAGRRAAGKMQNEAELNAVGDAAARVVVLAVAEEVLDTQVYWRNRAPDQIR